GRATASSSSLPIRTTRCWERRACCGRRCAGGCPRASSSSPMATATNGPSSPTASARCSCRGPCWRWGPCAGRRAWRRRRCWGYRPGTSRFSAIPTTEPSPSGAIAGEPGRRATAVPYSTAYRPGAPFKGEEILADLETILRQFRPTQIFVSHPADHHPDHAALYLFTRVALWDLQGAVPAAALHPYLVHYPHWPGEKGFHPREELRPPAKLASGFCWRSRELEPGDVEVKQRALAAHRTQFAYSKSRLLPFVGPNELYGNLDVPA